MNSGVTCNKYKWINMMRVREINEEPKKFFGLEGQEGST